MTLCSNQFERRGVARSLTLVGLIRVSTGPAIRVRLRGWAGLSLAAMIATAASAAGQGWQTAIRWAPGPMSRGRRSRGRCSRRGRTRPCSRGTSRALRQSVTYTSWSGRSEAHGGCAAGSRSARPGRRRAGPAAGDGGRPWRSGGARPNGVAMSHLLLGPASPRPPRGLGGSRRAGVRGSAGPGRSSRSRPTPAARADCRSSARQLTQGPLARPAGPVRGRWVPLRLVRLVEHHLQHMLTTATRPTRVCCSRRGGDRS